MNASADVTACKMFRDGLRSRRVALRSGMHRDDIEDVQILEAEDLDVAATRQVLKIGPASDGTDEVDAADVLEAIAIVLPPVAVAATVSVAPVAPVAPPELRAPVEDDDAFLAYAEPISTCGVTFDFEDPNAPPTQPRLPQRRLGWIVGTVLACCGALLVGEAVASGVSSSSSAPSSSYASSYAPVAAPPVARLPVLIAARMATSTPPSSSTMPSIDVRSLPAALVGTIAATPSSAPDALVVDGKRMTATTVVVGCGKHIVKTSRRKAHPVDVPCGGQVAVR